MDEISSNSCSGSTVSTLQQYRSVPQINFPPPPMQSSSAYEYYANIVVPKRRLTFESLAPGPMNGYHDDLMHENRAIEYPQPETYYNQYVDNYGRRQMPCYECISECVEMQNSPVYYTATKSHDDYDIYSKRRHLSDRFGLSKKGLLQIDYSLSWMNLQQELTV